MLHKQKFRKQKECLEVENMIAETTLRRVWKIRLKKSLREKSKKKKRWNMGNRKYRRILRGQSRRSSIWILDILEKENKENEGKEFNHRSDTGNFPKMLKHELID